MDRIERITRMEQALDAGATALALLTEALERYRVVLPAIKELEAYYQSDKWMEDFESDERGELPPDLKRGVLSEDAVWSMLANNADVMTSMEETLAEWGEGDC